MASSKQLIMIIIRLHRLPIKPVKQITPEEVKAIYERNYWLDGHCNFITETHPYVATIHFDCAVNCGLTQASKLLQRSVEALDDGIIGPVTLAAMKTLTDEVAAKNYLNHRLIFYTKLILHNPSQQKFKASWFHRLTKLSKELNLGWVAQ
jgi:lysozyme family protein